MTIKSTTDGRDGIGATIVLDKDDKELRSIFQRLAILRLETTIGGRRIMRGDAAEDAMETGRGLIMNRHFPGQAARAVRSRDARRGVAEEHDKEALATLQSIAISLPAIRLVSLMYTKNHSCIPSALLMAKLLAFRNLEARITPMQAFTYTKDMSLVYVGDPRYGTPHFKEVKDAYPGHVVTTSGNVLFDLSLGQATRPGLRAGANAGYMEKANPEYVELTYKMIEKVGRKDSGNPDYTLGWDYLDFDNAVTVDNLYDDGVVVYIPTLNYDYAQYMAQFTFPPEMYTVLNHIIKLAAVSVSKSPNGEVR